MPTIKHRRGTAAEWTAEDPLLAAGEKGVELDTGKFKVGNGIHYWATLPYFVDETAVDAKDAALMSAINTKAPIAGPAFTGNPTAPTPPAGAISTSIANTEWAVERAKVGNLLTANQASVETDLTGLIVTNVCTIARSTAEFWTGTASLEFTATMATAGVAAGTPRSNGNAYRVLVTPGLAYTGSVMVKSAARPLRVRILWWNAAGGYISDTGGAGVPVTTWTRLSSTGVAPSTAAYASLEVDMTTAGSIGDKAYWDGAGVWAGAGGEWAMPGTPITNLGTRITRPNTDDRLVEAWNGSAWSVVDYDSGLRDITSLLEPGWSSLITPNAVTLRRVGGTVMVNMWNVTKTKTGADMKILALPAGLRPAAVGSGVVYYFSMTSSSDGSYSGSYSYDDALYWKHTSTTMDANGIYGTYMGIALAADPIPTSLPGTLITAAPA